MLLLVLDMRSVLLRVLILVIVLDLCCRSILFNRFQSLLPCLLVSLLMTLTPPFLAVCYFIYGFQGCCISFRDCGCGC